MRNPHDRPAVPPVPAHQLADLRKLDDNALCEQVRAHRRRPIGSAAFATLYERHRDTVMAQAYRITADRDRAEDLAEETFARVLRALSGGHGPRTSVLGYLLVTLRSEAARSGGVERSTVAVTPEAMQEMLEEMTPDFAETHSERDQVSQAFAQLPQSARRVLWLVDVEQLELEEAAEYLGLKMGALRVQVHRARKRLGTAYLQQYVEASDPDCLPVSRHLASLVRSELGKREHQRVDAHLRSCAPCTRQVARLESLQRQLRNWAGPVALGAGTGAALGGSAGSAAEASAVTVTAGEGARLGASPALFGWVMGTTGAALFAAGLFWAISAPAQREPAAAPPTTAIGGAVPGADPAKPERRSSHAGDGGRGDPTGPRRPWSEQRADGRDAQTPGNSSLPNQNTVDADHSTPNWKLRE